MSDDQVTSQSLARLILEWRQKDYQDAWDTWKSLDTKAQGTAAVAGILLATTLGLVKDAEKTFNTTERLFLLLGLLALVWAIVCCVRALRLRRLEQQPEQEVARTIGELMPVCERGGGSVSGEVVVNFYQDLGKIWTTAATEMRVHNEHKAGRIQWAQWLLVAAAVLVALISMVAIFKGGAA